MTTSEPKPAAAPLSEAEIAAATAAPAVDPELDEVDAADIDAPPEEPEQPFAKVQAASRRLSP